jgi:uncharacterized protein (DUF1697 family)
MPKQSVGYHAFLRGINVGGHHKVPMATLRTVFEAMGFTSVRTLLNSGNVSFESDRADLSALEREIESRLAAELGFPIPVMIRTDESLRAFVAASPFALILSEAKEPDIRLYITFTRSGDNIPSVVDLRDSNTIKAMEELERRLGKDIPTRNWNTVVKMPSIGDPQ